MEYIDDDIDFAELSKKRTFTELGNEQRDDYSDKPENTVLDMRIVKLITDEKNVVSLDLIFRVDHHQKNMINSHFMFLTLNVKVFDRNRVLENNLNSPLAVGYISTLYKENAERLLKELFQQSAEIIKGGIVGDTSVSESESQDQVARIIKAYLQGKKDKN
ncbi:hypothetical protein [Pedobacter sp. FW305-3-2-15-E-R2A2]|uniref:hypothetical protein n=1 Tax=Pedobacter sp. FW305-3-2-15-E-R2A2 TaxID=3140251 RepID=UPI00314070C6